MDDEWAAKADELRSQLLTHFDGAARDVSISSVPGAARGLEAEIDLMRKSLYCRLRAHVRMAWFKLFRLGCPDFQYRLT